MIVCSRFWSARWMYFSAILDENLETQSNPMHIEFCPVYTRTSGQKTAHSVRLTWLKLFSHCPLLQLPPQQQWYFGKIKQADAEKLLLKAGNSTGTFLIRKGDIDSQPDNYSLSVQDGNRVHHYLIKETYTGKDCMLLSLVPRHSNVSGKMLGHLKDGDHTRAANKLSSWEVGYLEIVLSCKHLFPLKLQGQSCVHVSHLCVFDSVQKPTVWT